MHWLTRSMFFEPSRMPKGTLENPGEADTDRGLVTLGYSGRICGVSR